MDSCVLKHLLNNIKPFKNLGLVYINIINCNKLTNLNETN